MGCDSQKCHPLSHLEGHTECDVCTSVTVEQGDTELVNYCAEYGWALVLAAHCCAVAGSAEKLWPVWSKDGTVLTVLSLAISGRVFFIPSYMKQATRLPCMPF